jgi:hypothetical protein
MIEIPLTRGFTAIVDDEDADLAQMNWCAVTKPPYDRYYAMRPLRLGNGKSSSEKLHRVIMARVVGRPLLRTELVDHKDHDGLNNTRQNLRLATPAQNCANQRIARNNTSGFKGVTWNKRYSKWAVQIIVRGQHIFLGYFTDKIEAAKTYNEAALAHFDSFACLNPIPDEVSNVQAGAD